MHNPSVATLSPHKPIHTVSHTRTCITFSFLPSLSLSLTHTHPYCHLRVLHPLLSSLLPANIRSPEVSGFSHVFPLVFISLSSFFFLPFLSLPAAFPSPSPSSPPPNLTRRPRVTSFFLLYMCFEEQRQGEGRGGLVSVQELTSWARARVVEGISICRRAYCAQSPRPAPISRRTSFL